MDFGYRMDMNRRTGELVCSRCGGDHRASLFADGSAYRRLLSAMEREGESRTMIAARAGQHERAEAWLHATDLIRELHLNLMPSRDCEPCFAHPAWAP